MQAVVLRIKHLVVVVLVAVVILEQVQAELLTQVAVALLGMAESLAQVVQVL
jgi:hypothetical protein